MQPMVSKMLGADGVTAGSVLLVDSVNNRTNGSLNAAEATETLRNALANNGKFTLVSAQQLSMAKQQLGLSPQDSLGTRSKAIGIARNVDHWCQTAEKDRVARLQSCAQHDFRIY